MIERFWIWLVNYLNGTYPRKCYYQGVELQPITADKRWVVDEGHPYCKHDFSRTTGHDANQIIDERYADDGGHYQHGYVAQSRYLLCCSRCSAKIIWTKVHFG